MLDSVCWSWFPHLISQRDTTDPKRECSLRISNKWLSHTESQSCIVYLSNVKKIDVLPALVNGVAVRIVFDALSQCHFHQLNLNYSCVNVIYVVLFILTIIVFVFLKTLKDI